MRIVLVGPGLMSIPPTGWGAIEIIVSDYHRYLTKLGHETTVINTSNQAEIIQSILHIKPDVVHIHYDDYIHIAYQIHPVTKIIVVTSHHAYFEQENKWEGYRQHVTHLKYLPSNVFHFALSAGIKDKLMQLGIPDTRIQINPNAADDQAFFYEPNTPKHADKSLYLGKIDFRKRQYLLHHIPSLYFAGRNADSRFAPLPNRYLGEWTKDVLFQELTHYGNLVLLSDGEADPLVVKEALICGLGLVLSEFATANLDLSLPFITVIPESKLLLSTPDELEQIIATNRKISLEQRKVIREYGQSNFAYTKRVQYYCDLLTQLLYSGS